MVEVVFSIDDQSGSYAVRPGDRTGTLGEDTEVRVRPKSAAGAIRFS